MRSVQVLEPVTAAMVASVFFPKAALAARSFPPETSPVEPVVPVERVPLMAAQVVRAAQAVPVSSSTTERLAQEALPDLRIPERSSVEPAEPAVPVVPDSMALQARRDLPSPQRLLALTVQTEPMARVLSVSQALLPTEQPEQRAPAEQPAHLVELQPDLVRMLPRLAALPAQALQVQQVPMVFQSPMAELVRQVSLVSQVTIQLMWRLRARPVLADRREPTVWLLVPVAQPARQPLLAVAQAAMVKMAEAVRRVKPAARVERVRPDLLERLALKVLLVRPV